jgi:pimeloyl-ACP methyl ester carboxylesterase
MNSKLVPTKDGVNLFLVEGGKSDSKETILFLHGYPDTHQSWQKQFDFFSKDYRVGAFDIRGAGKSSAPLERSGYRIEQLLSDVDQVIDSLVGKEGKIHAVGHDWGAVILWSYISHPERESRLKSFSAVSCPHPMLFFKNVFGKIFTFKPDKIYEGLHQIVKSYYVLFFQVPFLPELIWQSFGEELWKLLMQNSGLSENDAMQGLTKEEILAHTVNCINLYREAMQSGVQPLPRNPIQLPVSLFLPEDDLALTPELYDETESFVRNLRTFRIQANHWVHRERPDWFNQNLDSFLKANQAI